MLKKTLFFLVLCSVPAAARAEETLRWRAALTGGAVSEKHLAGVSNPGVTAAGGEIGRAFMDSMEFGYSFAYAGLVQKEKLTAAQTGYDVMFHVLFADFLQDTTMHGFYAGPQLGIVSRSLRKVGQNAGLNSMAIGARAGYNCPLSALFSAGLQVQYLYVGDAKATVMENSVNTTYRAPATSFAKYLLLLNYKF
jgi:hypothetical protein